MTGIGKLTFYLLMLIHMEFKNSVLKSIYTQLHSIIICIEIGGGFCCMSSFPYIWNANGVPKGDARFYLALFGQAITGIACPFVSSVPTKVTWLYNLKHNC